jgi:hypothetical protein
MLNSLGEWQTIDTVWCRRNWEYSAVKLTGWLPDENGHYKLRLCFTSYNEVDYSGLDTSENIPFTVTHQNLVSATHSTFGNVKQMLKYNDQNYVELVSGQSITLMFTKPEKYQGKIDYVLYSRGHYFTGN